MNLLPYLAIGVILEEKQKYVKNLFTLLNVKNSICSTLNYFAHVQYRVVHRVS